MIRRATPDSEAVASSEDDLPWPHKTFGSMPRSENSVSGLGGGIWSQTSRGSFKLDQEARRAAARQVHLGSAAVHMQHTSTARSAMTPSPTTSDPSRNLPFSIPLRPTAKAGRSLSHSQGQREMPTFPHANAGASDRSGRVSLDLVNETAEETDTESEPDLGHTLTQTTSHPSLGLFQRTSTFPLHFDMAAQNDRQRVDTSYINSDATSMDRLGNALEGMRLDGIQRNKQRWQTTPSGWDELHTINESRRHSLAGELPTRRGSLADSHEQDYDIQSPFSNNTNYNDTDTFTIPSGYRVPHVTLDAHERADIQQAINMQAQNRPRKELYIVVFKCSRAGVFYLLDNTGLKVSDGDMVIVEADRGQDLGTVQHARVSPEEARALLQKYSEEQYKWLMMFSRNNQAGAVNPNATQYGENQSSDSRPNMPSTRTPRDQFQNLKPKAIKRMAANHEVRMLKEKEGNEAKAKRCCQQKVFQHHLDMEILEAEFQWDWQKLIFYYYADHYVNFKELVNDLYKLYKVRLWMSAVNPASFSANAINQPPSGIGAGAITAFDPFRSSDFDNSYAMAYGNDPDPYGAVPPYQIGYNTYVPNYPSIPGMPNSFAPVPGDGTPAVPTHGHWPGATGAAPLSSPTITAPAANIGGMMSPIGSPPLNLARGPVASYGPPAFFNIMPTGGGGQRGSFNMPQSSATGGAVIRPAPAGRSSYSSGQISAGDQGREQQQQQQQTSPGTWSNQSRSQFRFPMSPGSMTFAGRQHANTLSGSSGSYDPTTQSTQPGRVYAGSQQSPTKAGNGQANR